MNVKQGTPKDLLGCHVSISGGVDLAPERARNIGCNTMQIFTANQRQWKTKPIDKETAKNYKINLAKFEITNVMSHDSYLINLCATDPDNYKKSVEAFAEEIERCLLLGVELLNFHPGSHLGDGEEKGIAKIAETLKGFLPTLKGSKLKLALENTSGQGTNLGYKFEQLAEIIDLTGSPERFGVCFDTCHGFAAGYDIATEKGWEAVWEEFDRIIGLKFLSAFHVNDSQGELGSRKDRHANLGEGKLSQTAFNLLVNEERFKNIPMYLETPGGDEGYIADLKYLRNLKK